MVSIVYCLGTVIFHVLLEFGDEHVNEGCLNWGREGEGYSAQIQCRRHWQEGTKKYYPASE